MFSWGNVLAISLLWIWQCRSRWGLVTENVFNHHESKWSLRKAAPSIFVRFDVSILFSYYFCLNDFYVFMNTYCVYIVSHNSTSKPTFHLDIVGNNNLSGVAILANFFRIHQNSRKRSINLCTLVNGMSRETTLPIVFKACIVLILIYLYVCSNKKQTLENVWWWGIN